MLQLVAIATAILPDLIKLLAADKGGAIAADVARAVTDSTGTTDPVAAKKKLAEDPSAAVDLQVKLAQIALDAAKVQNEEADKQRQDQIAALKTSLQAEIDNTRGARATTLEFVKAQSPVAVAPVLLSGFVLIGFFGLVGFLLSPWVPKDILSNQLVNITIGALVAAFSTVVSFWLGSSLSSRVKDAASIQAQAVQADQTADAMKAQAAQTTQVLKTAAAAKAATPAPAPVAVPAPVMAVAQPAPGAKADNFDACLGVTLVEEGGFSVDPADAAGPRNLGVTLAELKDWKGGIATPDDVKTLNKDDAREIHRIHRWNPMKCSELPNGVDLVLFDLSVNAGTKAAVEILQNTVGVTVDGSVGPVTVAAARAMDAKQLIARFSHDCITAYRNLARSGQDWAKRIQDIQDAALKMAG